MIKVENLSKQYANIYAVKNISFEVGDGEILGFLGPNGAGKSTTMKILTCFMPATSGTATMGGYDVFNESLKARQIIGYLPENVPLYTEMRVNEYLLFRSKLKNVARNARKRKIGECLEKCGIENVQNQIIGTLSKGYRQRVGLADTLLHDPKILVLDEPTIGLDPNQIRQVREIIKGLGEKRTVILSTHILPEVEMLCGRVVIINKGRIAAQDTPQNLVDHLKTGGNILVDLKGSKDKAEKSLLSVDGVASVEVVKNSKSIRQGDNSDGSEINTFRIISKNSSDLRESVFNSIVKNNLTILEMKRESLSLEDVFHHITMEEEGIS